MINTRSLKDSISSTNLPDDLKNLILTTEDNLPDEQFLTKFIEWRKIARIKDGEKP